MVFSSYSINLLKINIIHIGELTRYPISWNLPRLGWMKPKMDGTVGNSATIRGLEGWNWISERWKKKKSKGMEKSNQAYLIFSPLKEGCRSNVLKGIRGSPCTPLALPVFGYTSGSCNRNCIPNTENMAYGPHHVISLYSNSYCMAEKWIYFFLFSVAREGNNYLSTEIIEHTTINNRD